MPAPTTTADPRTTAVAVAQQLATAYADGDWVLARSISPEPNYTDAELDAGYAGLEASTLFLGDMTESADRIQMWLLMVAHEIDSGRERTSLYCIQWDYVTASNTIDKISGELVDRLDGFVPPGGSERGALVCSPDYDTASSTPAPPAATSPPSPPVMTSPGPDLSDWTQITFNGANYLCRPVSIVSNDFNCYRYLGGTPPLGVGTPDVRCTKRLGSSFDCTADRYYPSELDGFDVATIDGNRVLCDAGGNCWIWYSSDSPRSAVIGSPDYRCDFTGRCEPVGFG